MEVSDQILLSEFLRGHDQAFRSLSDRHVDLVYGVAMRNHADPSTAEEVVQDVFILLAKKARHLAKHPCLVGWLHTTSRNVARDARRKRLRQQQKLKHFAQEFTPLHTATTPEPPHEIDRAIQALPTQEREAILLRFFQDRDYLEIATQLAISEATARKRVSRGIKRLHSCLHAKLAAGTALALTAPAHLSEAATTSAIASTTAITSSTSTITHLIMTKTTASLTCTAIAIGSLAFIAIDQNAKRKQLAADLAKTQQELLALNNRSRGGAFDDRDFLNSSLAKTQKQKIADLEQQLADEQSQLQLAQADAAALREATAGLDDEVVVAYGKVEQIGSDLGYVFREALALSLIEKAGGLDSDESKKRLANFSIKAASITGLSKQIIAFENDPQEGSKFFSSTYKSVFDLDDQTTKKLEQVFAEQIAAAQEQELTLVNNPGLRMLEGEQGITEADINAWTLSRQEFYRGVREQLRNQIPADKQGEFDQLVELDGIGFNNISLAGNPLAFSLGGRQP